MVTFVARVRKRGDVYELTIPKKLVRELRLSSGAIVEVKINRVIYSPEGVE